MACGRVLISHQDGISIGKAFQNWNVCNVTSLYKDYNIGERHEILLDLTMQKKMVLHRHLAKAWLTFYEYAQCIMLRSGTEKLLLLTTSEGIQ